MTDIMEERILKGMQIAIYAAAFTGFTTLAIMLFYFPQFMCENLHKAGTERVCFTDEDRPKARTTSGQIYDVVPR